ncbi:dynamin-related protein 3A [Capsicum annuum]|uniref:dynamin-related protein 3A n=1 Tax=Capsicum annuum TaxID=4072 RepID=UPI001FB04D59|nr:dynamin-related protein 3A [Capsicum annuum]XP_047249406.1 dynamin-related protein 3A [Capsicum annuum]
MEMEMDYINTSHPNFIGGTKAHEMALQQVKSSRIAAPNPRQKDGVDLEKAPTSEKSLKSRAILARSVSGLVPDQVVRPAPEVEKTTVSGSNVGSSWGISSIFGGSDNRPSVKDNSISKPFSDPVQSMDHAFSMIHLREPPSVLRPSETHSDQETIEIAITKLLLRSYYDVVRKNIEDSVPKAIMHFLVNHTKRDLHNVFIKKLYRENLLEEMLQEPDEIAMKRKRTRETLRVLQQAFKTLEELPLDAETVERGYSLGTDPTGLPKIHGLPTSSMYTTSGGSTDSYTDSPKKSRLRNASHSGELQLPMYGGADSNGGGHNFGMYPTVGV